MIVCHCTALNDREVREQIDAGASSPGDVADLCGAGAHCGGCLPALERLLDEHDEHDGADRTYA